MGVPKAFRFRTIRKHNPLERFPWSAGSFLLAILAFSACSSDPSSPSVDPPTPTTVVVLEGADLQAPAGTVLPEGPTVQVLDQDGSPMAGIPVTFQVVQGGGSTPVPSRRTDGQGSVRVPWILGSTPDTPQRLRVTAATASEEIGATAIEALPGRSYFGRNGYTEYLPGTLPLVLSAPHGGDQYPAEIPDRTYGVTGADRNTKQLVLQIRDAIKDQTGFYPHIVISHLHRSKLDPNREIVEAAQGDPEAERAWWEFQTFIEQGRRVLEATFGEGLYIDLHGHGHEVQRLELGYLLSSNDLGNPDEVLSNPSFVSKSSLRALGEKPGVAFSELVRGPFSMGTLLEAEAVPAVPSQAQPNPGGDPYFTGGYNTARHGSRGGGSVSGIQIECNYSGVRDTEANRQALAVALARVLAVYFPEHFGIPFAPPPYPPLD